MDNMSGLINPEIFEAAKDAADAWNQLYREMKRDYAKNEEFEDEPEESKATPEKSESPFWFLRMKRS